MVLSATFDRSRSIYAIHHQKDQILLGTYRWINENLVELDKVADPDDHDFYLKAAGELILLCALYSRKFGRLDQPLDRFMSHVTRLLQRVEYLDHIYRKLPLFLPYALIFVSLKECGIELKGLRSAIQDLVDRNYVLSMELKSFQRMDLCYTLNRGHFKHSLPSLQELFKDTLFYKTTNLFNLRYDDVYSLTHIIFYLTDFGFGQNVLSNHLISTLRWMVYSLLGIYLIKKDMDVVAELLICCEFLKYHRYPNYWWSIQTLAKAQNPDGSISGPLFDYDKSSKMNTNDKKRYCFEQNYHTTFVATILSFLGNDTIKMAPYKDPILSKVTAKRLKDSITFANIWITNSYNQVQHTNLTYELYILLEKWIYYKIAHRTTFKNLCDVVIPISERIEHILGNHIDEVGKSDIGLVFLGVGILRKLNVQNLFLETFLQESYRVLKDHVCESAEQALNLAPVKYILNSLGLKCNPDTDLIKFSTNDLLPFGENTVKGISNFVSLITHYGNNDSLYNSNNNIALKSILRLYCLYAVSKYNLEDGLTLMRSMNYLNMSSEKTFDELLDFILSQQRAEGSFGYYGNEVYKLKKSNGNYDAIINIYTPITVSAVWTLGEIINKDFSLVNSMKGSKGKI